MVMWAGRFKKEIDKRTNDFNSSIRFLPINPFAPVTNIFKTIPSYFSIDFNLIFILHIL